MRNLNKKVLVFSFTLVIMFVVSIHSLADAEIITIKDSDGFEVQIEKPVEKIVCISSSLNEIMIALGAR